MDNGIEQFWKQSALIKSLGIAILTSIGLLILIVIGSMRQIGGNSDWAMLTSITMPTFIALYFLPRIIEMHSKKQKEFIKITDIKKYWLHGCFLTIFLLFYITSFGGKFDSTTALLVLSIHYLVVSVGEEYIYRYLIIDTMKVKYGNWLSIIISALMFAFILHNNENFMINLAVRFPLGVLWGWVTVKTRNISAAIVMHTVYNLMVLII